MASIWPGGGADLGPCLVYPTPSIEDPEPITAGGDGLIRFQRPALLFLRTVNPVPVVVEPNSCPTKGCFYFDPTPLVREPDQLGPGDLTGLENIGNPAPLGLEPDHARICCLFVLIRLHRS